MILFASDLHLSASTPKLIGRFVEFLAGTARSAAALYLLGDVFEYWAGDDDLNAPASAAVVAALRDCSDAGVEIGFIAGNRDFLIGDGFAAATGVRLLPDPHVLTLPTWQFVLTHGDQLCTDDNDYQTFRQTVRGDAWKAEFLAKPLVERKAIIDGLRLRSEESKRRKAVNTAYLMDVNANATEDFLRQHGYATLIHGHTHRPAKHDHIVDGIHCERWVLADWHESDGRGEFLAWNGKSLRRYTVA